MMTRQTPSPRRRSSESGFAIVELLVYLVVAGFVTAAVYQLLIGQSRMYTKQRELMDVHGTLRDAAALLSWELRQASAEDGDLYSINATSIVLRSVQGTGIVCAKHATEPRFGLWPTPGNIEHTADDSALVYAAGGADEWKVLKIQQVATPAILGVGNCVWPGTPASDIAVALVVVTVPDDTAGIQIGAPFRSFRRVEYGLYQDGGRWWLGRKVGAAASYEKLTGPLLASGGLAWIYRDNTGAVTADPAQVAMVEFVLRAESLEKAQVRGSGTVFQQDTLATRVALRG